MKRLDYVFLRVVRWSSWPLLLLVILFLITGYIMSGRFGMSRFMDEKTALTIHKLMHLPLLVLLVAHVVPAVYLAFQRWGWIKRRNHPHATTKVISNSP
ncbi:MAG: hypothetical protein M1608_13520 [Candidatus Omnitrophica bacterium]|nr:hypothetical protein [Candidatus Omnitrophota bacterium]